MLAAAQRLQRVEHRRIGDGTRRTGRQRHVVERNDAKDGAAKPLDRHSPDVVLLHGREHRFEVVLGAAGVDRTLGHFADSDGGGLLIAGRQRDVQVPRRP